MAVRLGGGFVFVAARVVLEVCLVFTNYDKVHVMNACPAASGFTSGGCWMLCEIVILLVVIYIHLYVR